MECEERELQDFEESITIDDIRDVLIKAKIANAPTT